MDGNQVIKTRERTHHKPRIRIVLACAACRVLDLPRQPWVGSEGIVRVAGQRIPFALAANHERRAAKARPESLLQLIGIALEDDIGVGEERERGGGEAGGSPEPPLLSPPTAADPARGLATLAWCPPQPVNIAPLPGFPLIPPPCSRCASSWAG